MSDALDGAIPVTLEAIYERDIDLLLLEELASNDTLRSYVLEKAFGRALAGCKVRVVAHSVVDPEWGESDIEVIVDTPGGSLALLIENKINAEFQPGQAARYRKRGDRRKGVEFDEYRVCLIAPSSFLSAASGADWPCQVSYEEVRGLLDKRMSEDRIAVKSALLALSVAKKFGKEVVPDQVVTEFWDDYYLLLDDRFPGLLLRGVGRTKSANSTWGYISKDGWPSSVLVYLKLPEGKVDLALTGYSAEYISEALGSKLGDGMSVEQTGKSAAVRLKVPPVTPARGFKGQELAAFETMIAAARLAALCPLLLSALGKPPSSK